MQINKLYPTVFGGFGGVSPGPGLRRGQPYRGASAQLQCDGASPGSGLRRGGFAGVRPQIGASPGSDLKLVFKFRTSLFGVSG